jgi:hypothetical protein
MDHEFTHILVGAVMNKERYKEMFALYGRQHAWNISKSGQPKSECSFMTIPCALVRAYTTVTYQAQYCTTSPPNTI